MWGSGLVFDSLVGNRMVEEGDEVVVMGEIRGLFVERLVDRRG